MEVIRCIGVIMCVAKDLASQLTDRVLLWSLKFIWGSKGVTSTLPREIAIKNTQKFCFTFKSEVMGLPIGN